MPDKNFNQFCYSEYKQTAKNEAKIKFLNIMTTNIVQSFQTKPNLVWFEMNFIGSVKSGNEITNPISAKI